MRGFLFKFADTVRPDDHCNNCSSDLIPMSLEQLKAFLKKVKDDPSHQEKLEAAADTNAVAAIAKEAG